MNIKLGVILSAMLVIAMGCSQHQKESATSEEAAGQHSTAVAQHDYSPDQSKLAFHLPADAVAYVQVTNPLSTMSPPVGSPVGEAMATSTVKTEVNGIADATASKISTFVPAELQPLVLEVLKHVDTRIELALIMAPDAPSPMPDLLVSFESSSAGNNALRTFVETASATPGLLPMPLMVIEPFNDQGYGVFSAAMYKMHVQQDSQNNRTTLFLTSNPAPEAFTSIVDPQQPPQLDHPAYRAFIATDKSLENEFLWVATEQLKPMIEMLADPSLVSFLQTTGLMDSKYFSLGLGEQGHLRNLVLSLDLPEETVSQWMWELDGQYQLKVGQDITFASTMLLPNSTDRKRLIDNMVNDFSEEDAASFAEFKTELETKTKLTWDEWLALLGNEVIVVADEFGFYMAVERGKDASWQKLLSTLKGLDGAAYQSKKYAGQTINYMKLPSIYGFADEADSAGLAALQQDNPMLELVMSGKQHYFWLEQDGYIIITELPQVLMEYLDGANKQPLSAWMTTQHQQPVDTAQFFVGGDLTGASSTFYYGYLYLMMMLSDYTGYQLDILNMPTASQFEFPDKTPYSLSVNRRDHELSIAWRFSHNAFEIGTGMGGPGAIAAVGILAAIALPAYDDYTVRAEVSQAVFGVSSLRVELTEFYMAEQRFPSAAEIESWQLPSMEGWLVQIVPDTGIIEIIGETAKMNAKFYGEPILLIPNDNNGYVEWTCSASDSDYLPKSCQY